MKNEYRNYKKLKISVHISLYVDSKKKAQLKNFRKVCKSFLTLSNKVRIFVHSNKKFKGNKKINFFYYDFNKIEEHPYKLTWFCRKIMEKQKNKYDVFFYSEDLILFTKKNFRYWLNHKDSCIKNDYNLGFLRYDIKNKIFYSPDQIVKSKYYVNLLNKKYVVPQNTSCALWIYDKKEFNNFIKTKYWRFGWKWLTISGVLLIREMSMIGWHGVNMSGIDMNRYIATIIPLKKGQLDKNSLIRDLTNKYSMNPRGLFGTFKVKDIMEKNLQEFKPITPAGRFFKRASFLLYYFSRINIKKYIKRLK